VEFQRLQVSDAFRLAVGEQRAIPFRFPVPWETPITEVYGQHLHGMTMGLRTELSVARAVDKGDLDRVGVQPLPAQEAILSALGQLGFRFKKADVEHGHLRGLRQSVPFYQEIEFFAGQRYAHALNELELTFVANPQFVDVILEVDKRGGLFTAGHDVFHHLRVEHATAGQTDWAAEIDGWLARAVLSRGGGFGGGYQAPGYGSHGHRHGHGRGLGAGAVVGGLAAGMVGGYVAGEMMQEAFDDGGDFGEF
jgi:sporulation-control protein